MQAGDGAFLLDAKAAQAGFLGLGDLKFRLQRIDEAFEFDGAFALDFRLPFDRNDLFFQRADAVDGDGVGLFILAGNDGGEDFSGQPHVI